MREERFIGKEDPTQVHRGGSGCKDALIIWHYSQGTSVEGEASSERAAPVYPRSVQ